MRRLAALYAALLLAAGCAAPTGPDLPPPISDPTAVPSRPGGVGSLDSVRYVVHVSVDGLRPDAIGALGSEAPAFTRLRTEAAHTHNARSDADSRHTLPNHATQLTGRPVLGGAGHGWLENVEPAPGQTLHGAGYVASAFDVVHDGGLRTAAYVSKPKFSLFRQSWGAAIDRYILDGGTESLVRRAIADLEADPAAYTFVHVSDPDAVGHEYGWDLADGSTYLHAVRRADARIGAILEAVEASDRLRGRTALVVTADHGGSGTGHYDDSPEHYTVPFYVWGPGILPADLYALNAARRDPGARASSGGPPVANGDAANVALGLLGLGPVPGSTWGASRPLRVAR